MGDDAGGAVLVVSGKTDDRAQTIVISDTTFTGSVATHGAVAFHGGVGHVVTLDEVAITGSISVDPDACALDLGGEDTRTLDARLTAVEVSGSAAWGVCIDGVDATDFDVVVQDATITSNTGGLLATNTVRLEVVDTDFGTDATDNAAVDLQYGEEQRSDLGAAESFTCDGSCD